MQPPVFPNQHQMDENQQENGGQQLPDIQQGLLPPFPIMNTPIDNMNRPPLGNQQLPPINSMMPPPSPHQMNFQQQPTPMQQAALNLMVQRPPLQQPQNPLQILSSQDDHPPTGMPIPQFLQPSMGGNGPQPQPFFMAPPIRPQFPMGAGEGANSTEPINFTPGDQMGVGENPREQPPPQNEHDIRNPQQEEHPSNNFNNMMDQKRPPPFPGPPPFMPNEFHPPPQHMQMNNERPGFPSQMMGPSGNEGPGFPQMRPNFIRHDNPNGMNFRPPHPHHQRPPFENNSDNNGGFFHQPHFNDNGPNDFRPRFPPSQSPGRKFRPRGNFGPRQFRPRSQRPVL